MAIAEIQQPVDNTQKLLTAFARAQLSAIDAKSVKQNSFPLFAIAAFLYGAINQLGKQSTLPEQLIREYLHNILCNEFGLPRHNIEGLVSSINRMMDEYYLLENIYHEGEGAAENWLTNDDADCLELKILLDSYKDFTLMDMKAAGMKTGGSAYSTQSSQSTLASKKSAWPMILSGVIAIGVVLTFLYFFLLV